MPSPDANAAHQALTEFAHAVQARSNALSRGQPEDQLRGPLEILIRSFGELLNRPLLPVGEVGLERLGRPDYAVESTGLLVGYVELKAPGEGAVISRFRGRNRDQAKRFAAIPNLIYTDGNEWALYHAGEPVGQPVRLRGDVAAQGPRPLASTTRLPCWRSSSGSSPGNRQSR